MNKNWTKCSVFGCNKVFWKAKEADPDIQFHRVPKNKDVRAIWVERCAKNFSHNSSYVCSSHFTRDDYFRIRISRILNEPGKLKLKPTALPTLNLPNDHSQSVTDVELNVDSTIKSLPEKNGEEIADLACSIEGAKQHLTSILNKDVNTQTENHSYTEIATRLKIRERDYNEEGNALDVLKSEHNELKTKYESIISELNTSATKIKKLEEENAGLKNNLDELKTIMRKDQTTKRKKQKVARTS